MSLERPICPKGIKTVFKMRKGYPVFTLLRVKTYKCLKILLFKIYQSTTSNRMQKKKRKIGHEPMLERTFVSFTVVVKIVAKIPLCTKKSFKHTKTLLK